jgi:hypothetical protein
LKISSEYVGEDGNSLTDEKALRPTPRKIERNVMEGNVGSSYVEII